MSDGFELTDKDQLKIGVRKPEPSNHPDARMRMTLADLPSTKPTGAASGVSFNSGELPMVYEGKSVEEYAAADKKRDENANKDK